MSPDKASLQKNQKKVNKITNPVNKDLSGLKRIPKFDPGTKVRISNDRGIFGKGYTHGWTREVFTVVSSNTPADKNEPITYHIIDENNKPIQGSFYEPELQQVNSKIADKYLIEKVLKRRTVKGQKEIFVKWVGYDDKFNSWVPEEQLIN